MACWISRPSLYSKAESIPIYYGDPESGIKGNIVGYEIPIGFEIVPIDTENLQESLYDAFNDCGWEDGKRLGIKRTDMFSIKEYERIFEIYVNGKFVATFCKDRELVKH